MTERMKTLPTSHDFEGLKATELYAAIAKNKVSLKNDLTKRKNLFIRKRRLKTINENELLTGTTGKVNKEEYFNHLGVIHNILMRQYKKFEPQNASASSSACT